jgi:hypothetical protein
MRNRFFAVVGGLVIIIASARLSPVLLAGQSAQTTAEAPAKAAWTMPRTAWGDPDLQGTYTSNDNSGVPVERPAKFGTREYLTDEEFAQRQKDAERATRDDKGERRKLAEDDTGDGPEHWYERGKTSRRTSLVVDPPDGMIPLTPAMKKRAIDWESTRFGKGTQSWLDFDLWDRCITKGYPTVMIPLGYNNSVQILQTPGYVAMLYEVIHDVRIIPLDGRPHIDQAIRQWWGDSRGHWEGDTLVVDMTNFSGKTMGNQQPAGSYRGGGAKQHIVERFKRVSPETLDYRVTLDDPEAFTRPWTMDIPLTQDDNYQMFEYACHEGNYSMVNMLSGARAKEKQTAEAANAVKSGLKAGAKTRNK